MAVDTAEKRLSISGIWLPLMPGVTSNATKDVEWRQQSAGSYSGIAPDAPGAATIMAQLSSLHRRVFSRVHGRVN